MAGAVPSTLHQMMKLIWKNEELVIHGKGSHFGRQGPIIYEVSHDTDFYMVELVKYTGEDLSPQIPMPGFGLGWNSQGIIEPILVLVKGAIYSLGYTPKDDDMKTKKKNDQALVNLIQNLYQSFPVWEYAEHEDLWEGICDLFEEIDAVIEEKVELAGIRDAELG